MGIGIKLQLLTAQRPSEVREMPISELGFYDDQREWNIAKERTKIRRDHIVPISDFAAELIDSILARGKQELHVHQR
jgi:integrase